MTFMTKPQGLGSYPAEAFPFSRAGLFTLQEMRHQPRKRPDPEKCHEAGKRYDRNPGPGVPAILGVHRRPHG